MPALLFACALVTAWVMQSLLFASDWTQQQGVAADAAAVSFLASHHAAADWAARNGWPAGAIAPAALALPVGDTPRAEWQHRIVAGQLFSYTRADFVQPPGFADVLASVGSSACLRAEDGTPTARCPHGTVALPPVVANDVRPGAALIVGS